MTSPMLGNAALTLRSRLRCIVMKKESQDSQVTKPSTNLLVLNEVGLLKVFVWENRSLLFTIVTMKI